MRRAVPLTPAVSLPVNPESFYFTYINEKGSDVSAAWLLDLRTRLLKEASGTSGGRTAAPPPSCGTR